MVVEVLESWHRSVGKETHDEFLEFPAFTGDGEIVDLVDGLEQGDANRHEESYIALRDMHAFWIKDDAKRVTVRAADSSLDGG